MELEWLNLFQGIATLVTSAIEQPAIAAMRLVLIGLGSLLIYLGRKGVLEALLMIPMGLGMATINAAVLVLDTGHQGTLFIDPLVTEPDKLLGVLQINWLQPIYTFTFSNGLIACVVLLGIGVLLDVGFVMARPLQSMFIALCAELGTVLVFPLGVAFGLPANEAAAVATIGGADGPMVMFTALILAKDLFVPITVVAYLYLGLTYGGYPYLIKWLVPKSIRALPMPMTPAPTITANQKIIFCIVSCIVLSLLFPVAAPLFFCLFLGAIVRESGLTRYAELIGGPLLYTATFFLGLLLGVLCEANTILNPKVLMLLMLGITALLISGVGGLMGGYLLYFLSGKRYNPVIGIAGVSCVPTCAKVAQKTVAEVAPGVMIMPHALGANISGVITSAILASIYITVIKSLTLVGF